MPNAVYTLRGTSLIPGILRVETSVQKYGIVPGQTLTVGEDEYTDDGMQRGIRWGYLSVVSVSYQDLDGEDVVYDNTISEWDADTVQEALDVVSTAFYGDTVRMNEGYSKWDDLRVPVTNATAAGNRDPSFSKVFDDGAASIGVYAYLFSDEAVANNEKELFFVCQMPHAWDIGSDINAHVHWIPTTNDAGVVRWGLEYTWSSINDVFSNTTIIYGNSDAVTNNDGKHIITGLGTISGTGQNLSSILICRIFRNSSSGADTYGASAGLLEFDFHYQIDSFGSDQEFIKDNP